MNPLFTEITESEATSVVGGKTQLLASPTYLSVNADATGYSEAKTTFFDTGYPQTYSDTYTILNDVSSKSGSRSSASIFYSDDLI